jgi:hypothetical protein
VLQQHAQANNISNPSMRLHVCTSCPAGKLVFDPCLEDTQAVVLSVLEAAVLAAADLPRITPNSTSSGVVAAPSASASAPPGSPSIIPSTGLEEELVQETIKVRAPSLYPRHVACSRCLCKQLGRVGASVHDVLSCRGDVSSGGSKVTTSWLSLGGVTTAERPAALPGCGVSPSGLMHP